jgi:hypothetical protein
MVRRFWTPVNAGDRRQSWTCESWLRQALDKRKPACKTALTTITMEETMQIDRRELTVSALALVTLSALRAGLGRSR